MSLVNRFYGSLDSLTADVAIAGDGPCLVVGSAPTAQRPTGYDPSWRLICVNASPAVAARLGLSVPDVVYMRGGLFGDETVDREAQQALAGQSARLILYREGNRNRSPTEERLHAIGYKFEGMRKLSEAERTRIIYEALGPVAAIRIGRRDISAGLISVMLASAIGKAPIVITGISLAIKGHYYSSSNLPRRHTVKDRFALRTMVRRGLPLFTTDPVLAADVGMPIWEPTGSRP